MVEEVETIAEESAVYKNKPQDILKHIKKLEKEMLSHAKNLDFEKAAEIRDEIQHWKKVDLGI